MDPEKGSATTRGHLFTVEILLEDETNGQALEKLLHLLNSSTTIKDYKVKSGIDLGRLIDLNVKEIQKKVVNSLKKEAKAINSKKIIEQLEFFKINNSLVRLTVVNGQGTKLNIPCRILNCDADTQNISVYHVDEKKVYLFTLSEIDNFVVA
jgi:hypothetical protein